MLLGIAAHKTVAVRELHFRQGFGIHHVAVANDFIEGEDVGRERVDFIVRSVTSAPSTASPVA